MASQNGEFADINGLPVYAGDLLRSWHFTGARRKRHFLYHVAVLRPFGEGTCLWMVPTSNLEPTIAKANRGGVCLLGAVNVEILAGHELRDFADRPKIGPKLPRLWE